MINKTQMMKQIIEACPSFQTKWNTFLDEWQDDKEDLPLYIILSDLVRHLIVMLQENETDSLQNIFQVVEKWLISGNQYVREAATVGVIEDLQNENMHKETKPEQFLPFLGPESKEVWKKLNGFWERGEPL